MDPDTWEGPPAPPPLPRDPLTGDLWGDEPEPAPESIPSSDEGDEASPGHPCDQWTGDPARVVFGEVAR